ncbi:MAG: hypothetical protein PHF97_07035 [Bacteroidales bacterium]|nr:hypothetical protein [Bacteroidales bacterium]MDD4603545.1 hypothetical protein [Bacteroidales bacterium]
MIRKQITGLFVLVLLISFSTSCHKISDNNPLPSWEDTSADSVTLTVTVMTQDGFLINGCYIYLALSKDSLKNNLLVRSQYSDGAGRVKFSRLYPRILYANCFANYGEKSLYGSFHIKLLPGTVRDTTLTLY